MHILAFAQSHDKTKIQQPTAESLLQLDKLIAILLRLALNSATIYGYNFILQNWCSFGKECVVPRKSHWAVA